MTVQLLNNTEIVSSQQAAPRKDAELNWTDNPDIRDLLDVIASIIAQEYIHIAKQNNDMAERQGFGHYTRNILSLVA